MAPQRGSRVPSEIRFCETCQKDTEHRKYKLARRADDTQRYQWRCRPELDDADRKAKAIRAAYGELGPIGNEDFRKVRGYLRHLTTTAQREYFSALFRRPEPQMTEVSPPTLDGDPDAPVVMVETPEHAEWRKRRAAGSMMLLQRLVTSEEGDYGFIEPAVAVEFLVRAAESLEGIYPVERDPEWAPQDKYADVQRIGQEMRGIIDASRDAATRYGMQELGAA